MNSDAMLNRVKELCDEIETEELSLAAALENFTVCMELVLIALGGDEK